MSDLEEGEVVDSDGDKSIKTLSTAIDSKDTGRANSDNIVAGFACKADTESVSFSSLSSSIPSANLSYQNHRSKTMLNSDDSTSDEDTVLWNQKRAKYIFKQKNRSMETTRDEATLPLFQNPLARQNGNEKPQKKLQNNIWGSVLEEQCLTQGMKSFDVENSIKKHVGDRNVESYDFTKAANDTRPFLISDEDNMEGKPNDDDPFGGEVVDLEPNEGAGAIRRRKRKHVKKRLGERSYDKIKSRDHIGVTKDDTEAKIVAALVEHLQEPKVQLLTRVVNVLGKEKTLHLYHLTEDVEESGGMMTLDASRRRTKGGVFIQLIKTDKHIAEKDVKEIFAEETKQTKKMSKSLTKKRRERNRGGKVLQEQSPTMHVDKDTEMGSQEKYDGRGDGMESSDIDRCDASRKRNVVFYDSDDNSDETLSLTSTPGTNTMSYDGEASRGSADGASDSGTILKIQVQAVTRDPDDLICDEDMLDIMPDEGETID